MTDPTPEALRALLETLYARERSGINLNLDHTRRLLAALGSPEKKLPAIHVAGTNGKGSVSVLVASALKEAGFRVGLYTSPHLISFGERIQVDGEKLSPREILSLFARVEAAGEKEQIRATFFEATTAMAFLKFADAEVDYAVLEVGLGGRLDATNVCHPLVTAVVTVDFDHMQYLGDTLAKIAREKAGIAKPGIPMVCGQVSHEARVSIGRRCAEVGAPLTVLGEDFFFLPNPTGLSYQGPSRTLEGVPLSLRGPHQRHNAAVALRLLETLDPRGERISDAAIRKGFARAVWPGRLELLGTGPRYLLDGAHNPHGAKALRDALDDLFTADRVHLVFGASGDKDVYEMLRPLVPRVSSLIACQATRKGALPPEEITKAALALGVLDVSSGGSVKEAILSAERRASPKDIILIAGSLFVIGEAEALFMERAQAAAGHPPDE